MKKVIWAAWLTTLAITAAGCSSGGQGAEVAATTAPAPGSSVVASTTSASGPATTAAPVAPPPAPTTRQTTTTRPPLADPEAVVGMSLDKGRDLLEAAGYSVTVEERIDPELADGTIISQAADGTTKGLLVVVSRRPVVDYLADLGVVAAYRKADQARVQTTVGPQKVGGKTYARSVAYQPTSKYSGNCHVVMEFDVSGGYKEFATVLGFADDASLSVSAADVVISLDGETIAQFELLQSAAPELSYPVEGGRRLAVELAFKSEQCNLDRIALGDAHVTGLPD